MCTLLIAIAPFPAIREETPPSLPPPPPPTKKKKKRRRNSPIGSFFSSFSTRGVGPTVVCVHRRTMQACAHVYAAHVQAFAACGVSTRHRPVLITYAHLNGGKGKHRSAWRTKTAATSKEEEAQQQRRQHVPANEQDAHVQTGRMEDPMEWEDEVEDGLVWDEYQGEETAGLTAEEDYVTPGNRIVLDACDNLFEMVEEEMKVRNVRKGRSHERTRVKNVRTTRRRRRVGHPEPNTRADKRKDGTDRSTSCRRHVRSGPETSLRAAGTARRVHGNSRQKRHSNRGIGRARRGGA